VTAPGAGWGSPQADSRALATRTGQPAKLSQPAPRTCVTVDAGTRVPSVACVPVGAWGCGRVRRRSSPRRNHIADIARYHRKNCGIGRRRIYGSI